jgi:hypothetical protein
VFNPGYSFALTVTEGAAAQKHWLHFDAKYRLEPAEVVEILHGSSEEVMADADDDEIGYEQEISRLHRRATSARAELVAPVQPFEWESSSGSPMAK